MATVTNTDFVANFSGVSDTNPYTITGVTEIDGPNSVRVTSGSIRNAVGNSSGANWRLRINGTATAATIRASMETAGAGSYNQKGPAILNASGEGYGFLSGFNEFPRLYRIAADGTTTQLHTTSVTPYASGDRQHLELDPGTGALRCYIEGTQVTALNATDTTFNTGMMPGVAQLGADANMAVAISMGGDYLGGAPAPSITNVDGDNTVTANQTNVVVTGANFATAVIELRQGANVLTPSIDSQNATTVQYDMVFDAGAGPHLKHGAVTLAVVNGDTQEATQAITVTAVSGSAYVDVGTPNADPDIRLTSTGDVVSGDQVEYGNVQGGTIADVTVNADLTWEAAEAVTSFDFRVWDQSDSTWGVWETQTINAAAEVSVWPRWMPLILAERLSWLRGYAGLHAAAVAEAAGSAQWAKPALYNNIKVDVHSVPGYQRPGWEF